MSNLKKIRTERSLTQGQVAHHLKISRAAYTNIENGKRDPDTATILALSDLFGVSVDELLGRETAYQAGTMAGLKLDEKRLLREFRKLSVEGKAKVFEFVLMAYHSFPGDRDDQE
jgi:transcriptional regulator with XRE-family HTH domain